MGFFDFFKSKDINKGVEEYRKTKGAVLIDVRTEEEFLYGHIESSLNIPLQSIDNTLKIIKDKNAPIFVYCRSGGRSSQAASILKNIGYTNINDIGGIMSYKGAIVR